MGGSETLQMVAGALRIAGCNGKLHEPDPSCIAIIHALPQIWEDAETQQQLPRLDRLQDALEAKLDCAISNVHDIYI